MGDGLSVSEYVFVSQVGGVTIPWWKCGLREQAPKTRGDGTCALIDIKQWATGMQCEKDNLFVDFNHYPATVSLMNASSTMTGAYW